MAEQAPPEEKPRLVSPTMAKSVPSEDPSGTIDTPPKEDQTGSTRTGKTGKTEVRRRKASQARTENVIAAFLFAILLGCAAIWLEQDRCPGALRMAVYDSAPLSVGIAVPIAALVAMRDRFATRREKFSRGTLFAVWAAAAALALSTAVMLELNRRGKLENFSRPCLVTRQETVPAPMAGVREWILVVRCADRMSLVRIDVDRDTWWRHEPGTVVQWSLKRGAMGYEWVETVPELGPPIRSLPNW